MLALTSLFHFALPAAQVDPEIELNMELVQEGDLIANTNTGKVHRAGCRAIRMMKEEHVWHTDTTEGFTLCAFCGKVEVDTVLDKFLEIVDPGKVENSK